MLETRTDQTRAGEGCPGLAVIEAIAAGCAADAAESSHLSSCGACRDVLEELRAEARTHARLRMALAPPEGGSCAVDLSGDLIPGYTLLEEINRGSQGIVYKAVQERTKRTVAVKMLLGGAFATERQRARFEREVEIVAGLNHPGIVTIYDRTPVRGGRYAYAMEYVDGSVPVDAWRPAPDGGPRAGMRSKLLLFAEICDAVNYAHQRGVMHRDLKPANILIDAAGKPHVMDFGIAKALGTDASHQTLTLEFAGTLAYASPEQIAGCPDNIDIRTDVYSLGVILFQMLAERMPHPLDGCSIAEAARIVTEEDAPRLGNLDRSWRGDLDTIAAKALERDAGHRYQSAAALAADVRRHLTGHTIEARRDSTWYVLRKSVARHRLGFAFACTVLVVLVAGLIVSITFWRQAALAQTGLESALEQAAQREKDIRQVANAQTKMLASVDPQTMGARLREDVLAEARAALDRPGGNAEEVAARLQLLDSLLAGTNFTSVGVCSIDRNVLTPALEAIERDYAGQPLVQAALWQTIADVYLRLGLYDAAEPPAERALATRRRELGDGHPDTLASINAMYWLLWRQDKRADAEPYMREALDGWREALERSRRDLGDDNPATLKAMEDMARFLWNVGKYAEAEQIIRTTMNGRRRVLGDDHPDTLEAISGMGTMLWSQGRHLEAEPYFREAMEGRRRVLGDLHERTLLSINNMGLLLTSAGRLTEAEPYHREALEGFRRAMSDDHESTLVRIRNLVSLLQAQERFPEAESFEREILGCV